MGFLKEYFPNVPIMALTATADKVTRRDIVRQLRLSSPEIFISSFDRPNLSLDVRPGQKRMQQIEQFLKTREGEAGIIYCFSRRNCETVAQKLIDRGIKADFYHAGLDPRRRELVQENFIQDKTTVICATIAFGMGIDKSNVRWVIHYDMPGSIESYYQEIGRAGRDGVRSHTLLFYSYGDVMKRKELWANGNTANLETRYAKLDRMYKYASAQQCRRKILLSYFGEHLAENCGNCDVCKNPPTYFDATVLAQKAISCALRLRERVGMNMLINVLRGSRLSGLLSAGYDKIKTYGVGKDLSFADWRAYVEQMINDGLLEVVIDDHNRLRVTEAGRRVVFDGATVQLVNVVVAKEREEAKKENAKRGRAKPVSSDSLFERLRSLRRTLAQQRGFAPYQVFSDATLHDMVRLSPNNDEQMRAVSGVGEQKLRNYGEQFIQEIRAYKKSLSGAGTKKTYQVTHDLLKTGKTPAQVAHERGLGETTIFSHIAHLYEIGEPVRLSDYISKDELRSILDTLRDLKEPYKLKEIHAAMNGSIDYGKIRLAIAYCNRKTKSVS